MAGNLTTPDLAAIVRKLTPAQRECGDVLDRLPCLRCGASSLKQCPVSIEERSAAAEVINNTPGLMNRLLRARAHLLSETNDADR